MLRSRKLGLELLQSRAMLTTLGVEPVEFDAVATSTYDRGDWFVADSFSFGVEREMKESGEKGGTEDINIGVGELQECTISKSMDWASPRLAR